VLTNRYDRHVLILCSLDSTKSAVPVEQTIFFNILVLVQGIFIPTPGDQPHSTGENGNLLFFCVCQMFR
jgi:hypothetical protein